MIKELENTLVAEPGEDYDEVEVSPIQVPKTRNYNITELIEHAPGGTEEEKREWLNALFASMSQDELAALNHKWAFWARHNQKAPLGNWTFWLLLAGRGFGKTRTGAEWINERVQSGKAKRIALVAPTAADVRKVMVEGESGILAISPPWNRPLYEPSKLQLTWPNGAIAQLFSAEEPERLRGPQCDTFWADELAAWKKLQETWDMLQFGFRLGNDPRGVITTTPKPLPIIKELVADNRDLSEEGRGENWSGETVVTRGSTYDNRANLAPKFFQKVVKKYEGTRLGRQELDAAILEDMPGALWDRKSIDANRIPGIVPFPNVYEEADIITGERPLCDMDMLRRAARARIEAVPEDMTRIIVAVDPNVSNTEGSDEIGIVVAGRGMSGRGYVLADASMKGSPLEWSSVAIICHDVFGADKIVGEANQGGNMVEYTIASTAKHLKKEGTRSSDFISVALVHATRGKVTRAEPVSNRYEQNSITHVGTLTVLEDQMCLFTSDFDRKAMGYSPDRVDALVWAFTHLYDEGQAGDGLFDHMRQEVARQIAGKQPVDVELVLMKAPPGVGMAFGMEGDMYKVEQGHVRVKQNDVKALRQGGYVEVAPG